MTSPNYNLLWVFEATCAALALIGALISARFWLRLHGIVGTLNPNDKRYTAGLTRRRTAATLCFVQATLFVACVFRIFPTMGIPYVPTTMRFLMSSAIIRCCLKNEADRRRGAHLPVLAFPQKKP